MKNIIITGASRGFGKAIAHKFLKEQCNIAICARNSDELKFAQIEMVIQSYNKTNIYSMPCDVSNEIQVNTFIDNSIEKFNTIDAIILNAGVYGPMGALENVSLEDWKSAFDINFYGVLLPCRRIINHFKQQKKGKIIIVSGGGATNPMPNITAYAASKAAVVRLMESLALELKPYNIDVNAIAPGPLSTKLVDQVLDAGPDIVGFEFFQKNLKWKTEGATSPELGAGLIYYLTTPESNGITGKLISAQWDNWKDLKSHINELNNSDIYSLRRIVPEDRGYSWK
jgi:short-subunit dehydrogenase